MVEERVPVILRAGARLMTAQLRLDGFAIAAGNTYGNSVLQIRRKRRYSCSKLPDGKLQNYLKVNLKADTKNNIVSAPN